VFADSANHALTSKVEQILIEKRVCFQIIFDSHLKDLSRYRALILAGCVALSDDHIERIKLYVRSGGHLCIIGPVATHDEWLRARDRSPLDNLPVSSVVRVREDDDAFDAVRRACGDRLTLRVAAARGLCAELTRQSGRYLLHLVNYRGETVAESVTVQVRLPDGRRVESVALASPERKGELQVPFEERSGVVNFTVEEVPIYEIAVIATK
jgi:hypothetical protein